MVHCSTQCHWLPPPTDEDNWEAGWHQDVDHVEIKHLISSVADLDHAMDPLPMWRGDRGDLMKPWGPNVLPGPAHNLVTKEPVVVIFKGSLEIIFGSAAINETSLRKNICNIYMQTFGWFITIHDSKKDDLGVLFVSNFLCVKYGYIHSHIELHFSTFTVHVFLVLYIHTHVHIHNHTHVHICT